MFSWFMLAVCHMLIAFCSVLLFILFFQYAYICTYMLPKLKLDAHVAI